MSPHEDRQKHCPKRNPAQKAADRLYVERRIIQCAPHAKIAEELSAIRTYKVSRHMVTEDVAKVIEMWKNETITAIDEHRRNELKALELMENELWSMLEQSRREATEETVEQDVSEGTPASGGPGAAVKASPSKKNVKMSKLKKSSYGEPAIMAEIMKVRERKAKMLGLDSAVKMANPDSNGMIVPVATCAVIYLPDNGRAADSPDPIKVPPS